MGPSFDPQSTLQDAIDTARSRGTSALAWGLLLMAGVAFMVFGSNRRR